MNRPNLKIQQLSSRIKWLALLLGVVLLLAIPLYNWLLWEATEGQRAQAHPHFLLWRLGVMPYDASAVLPGLYYEHEVCRSFEGKSFLRVSRSFGGQLRRYGETGKNFTDSDGNVIGVAEIYIISDSPFWKACFKEGKCVELGFSKG